MPDRTTSELERTFLRLCGRHRLPQPEVNVWIGSDRVDFLWREQRVIVETDSYRYHRGTIAFEDDHARDNRLMAQNFDVLRFTYWRVINEPEEVISILRARLTLARGRRARTRRAPPWRRSGQVIPRRRRRRPRSRGPGART